MKAVVLGASAGLGRAIAERLAANGYELVIVARDERDLAAMAADLRLRFGVTVHALAVDLADPATGTLAAFIGGALGQIGVLFAIAGLTDPDDRGSLSDQAVTAVVNANFLGPARVLNALRPLCGPQSHIVLAGSVAAIRPRGGNAVYGAAKLALESYGMAIRHAFSDRLGSVCCYRLGYIKTAMTFGQKLPLPAVTPEQAADIMVRRLGRSGIVYYPGFWAVVAFVLKILPWFVYRRLRF